MGSGKAAWLAILIAGAGTACGDEVAPAKAPRVAVDSLWDLAPHDASSGVVVRDGVPARALALAAMFDDGAMRRQFKERTKRYKAQDLGTAEGWARAGLDPMLGAAAFAWTDPERGRFLVLPVKDRDAFRRAFELPTVTEEGKTYERLPQGQLCAPAAGRYVCSPRARDIAEAAAPHRSPLATAVAKLSAEDRGDIESYGGTHQRELMKAVEPFRQLGRLIGVAGSVRVRADGVSGRVHVLADELTPLAVAFRGAETPPRFRAAAATSPTAAHFAIDARAAVSAQRDVDKEYKSELLERLTGEVDITTSGHGLAGLYGHAALTDGPRVEAFLKKTCEEQSGTKRKYALKDIRATEHGCGATFDPSLLLLPVKMNPTPVAASVGNDGALVFTIGDATAPAAVAAPRDGLPAAGTLGAKTFAGREAAVVFTRSPWVGPDVGAGAAFKAIVSLLDEDDVREIEAFSDLGAHVAQATLALRADDDGFVFTADAVTFAHDPPAARAAFEAALAQRTAGDMTAYRTALAAIERDHPGTLAAQRVRDLREQGPWFGAGVAFLGWLGGVTDSVSKEK